jgi:hypothetical protein
MVDHKMKIPDSVFESVIKELPVDATNIEIIVAYSYAIPSLGTSKGSSQRFFPSKAEATFRRETAKVEEVIKKVGKDAADAMTMVKTLEDRLHKRLNKLERKNDTDTTGDS